MKDGSRFFVTGHPEYDPDTLDKEYRRDLAISDIATMPKNYYRNDDMHNEILVIFLLMHVFQCHKNNKVLLVKPNR